MISFENGSVDRIRSFNATTEKLLVQELKKRAHHTTNLHNVLIGHFTVVYLVAKPLIRSKADGNRDRDLYLVSVITK